MVRANVVTVMRRYAQDAVNQEESEQNAVDGTKRELIPQERRCISKKSGW